MRVSGNIIGLALRLTLLLAAALPVLSGSSATPPNFIFISVDDLGYADIGPFGSTVNRTPNLDRMAREGRRFTSFYAAPLFSSSVSVLSTPCPALRRSTLNSQLFFSVHPLELR